MGKPFWSTFADLPQSCTPGGGDALPEPVKGVLGDALPCSKIRAEKPASAVLEQGASGDAADGDERGGGFDEALVPFLQIGQLPELVREDGRVCTEERVHAAIRVHRLDLRSGVHLSQLEDELLAPQRGLLLDRAPARRWALARRHEQWEEYAMARVPAMRARTP